MCHNYHFFIYFWLLNNVSETFILDLEKSRFKAMEEGDVKTLNQLISEELFYIHSNGEVDIKETFIGFIENGSRSYNNFVIEDAKIRIYGILAIINGICTYERNNPDGSIKITRLRYTSAYAKSDGDWKFVSWQSLIMSP